MSEPQSQTYGSLSAALENAGRFLDGQQRIAAAQAVEILKSIPDQPGALLILGTAHRRLGDSGRARSVLERLVQLQPGCADGCYELGCPSPAPANRQIRRLICAVRSR